MRWILPRRFYSSITQFSIQNNSIAFSTDKGPAGSLLLPWLRDHCACPSCLHPSTKQKLHSSADVSLTASPKSIRMDKESLYIQWDKNSLDSRPSLTHDSQYSLKELHGFINNNKKSPMHRIEWDRNTFERNQQHLLDYEQILQPKGFQQMLSNLKLYGLTFLKNVPTTEDQVAKLAKVIGPIRNTFYGPTWDVKSIPQSKNIAYTNLYLTLHMDLIMDRYFECPPGLEFLHSLKNDVKGGESIFLDSFKAVSLLKKEFPEDYKVLSQVPVTFHYKNDGHHMEYTRPTISENPWDDEGLSVYYAPPFQGPLQGDQKQLEKFYKSFKRFQTILNDPSLLYKLYLKPGYCALFANRRVLHGRLEFDATSGHRHFKGTYVDYDDFKDKLRIHNVNSLE